MRPTCKVCPHCGLNVNTYYWDHHMRDTGDEINPLGCIELWKKRNSQ